MCHCFQSGVNAAIIHDNVITVLELVSHVLHVIGNHVRLCISNSVVMCMVDSKVQGAIGSGN